MSVDTAQIKQLRELTGIGVMECKKALEDAGGDFAKARALLLERAVQKAEKKADRETRHGVVHAYIHGNGRIGVLVEVLCETDFLAASGPFRELVHDLALHIASEDPRYIAADEVPAAVLEQVRTEAEAFARAQGKPERALGHIVEGKVRKFLSDVCLLEQRFIKDTQITVGDLLRAFVASSGENVRVTYFARREIR